MRDHPPWTPPRYPSKHAGWSLDKRGPMKRAMVTNQTVGLDIGLTHSAVSRLRSGDRLPSFEVIANIEKAYNWLAAEQLMCIGTDCFPAQFELVLGGVYGFAPESPSD